MRSRTLVLIWVLAATAALASGCASGPAVTLRFAHTQGQNTNFVSTTVMSTTTLGGAAFGEQDSINLQCGATTSTSSTSVGVSELTLSFGEPEDNCLFNLIASSGKITNLPKPSTVNAPPGPVSHALFLAGTLANNLVCPALTSQGTTTSQRIPVNDTVIVACTAKYTDKTTKSATLTVKLQQ